MLTYGELAVSFLQAQGTLKSLDLLALQQTDRIHSVSRNVSRKEGPNGAAAC